MFLKNCNHMFSKIFFWIALPSARNDGPSKLFASLRGLRPKQSNGNSCNFAPMPTIHKSLFRTNIKKNYFSTHHQQVTIKKITILPKCIFPGLLCLRLAMTGAVSFLRLCEGSARSNPVETLEICSNANHLQIPLPNKNKRI
jgi:hypothetical protein